MALAVKLKITCSCIGWTKGRHQCSWHPTGAIWRSVFCTLKFWVLCAFHILWYIITGYYFPYVFLCLILPREAEEKRNFRCKHFCKTIQGEACLKSHCYLTDTVNIWFMVVYSVAFDILANLCISFFYFLFYNLLWWIYNSQLV